MTPMQMQKRILDQATILNNLRIVMEGYWESQPEAWQQGDQGRQYHASLFSVQEALRHLDMVEIRFDVSLRAGDTP